jgi:hypothetical protein
MDMPDRRRPPHDLAHTHEGSSWAARISDMKERLESEREGLAAIAAEAEGKVFRDEEFVERLAWVADTEDDIGAHVGPSIDELERERGPRVSGAEFSRRWGHLPSDGEG